MAKKIPYETIKEMFEKENYQLLTSKESYRNSKTKVDIICNNKHYHDIIPSDFKNGTRCAKCCGLAKHTIEFVKEYAQRYNYKVLDKVYVNSNSPLNLVCPFGHDYLTTFGGFRNGGNRCRSCRSSKGEKLVDFILSKILPKEVTYEPSKQIIVGNNQVPYEFDFLVHKGRGLFIEYDGEPHFRPVPFYGGEEGFKAYQQRDKEKDEYVESIQGKILRIPYTLTNEEVYNVINVFLQNNEINTIHISVAELENVEYHMVTGYSMKDVTDYYLQNSMEDTIAKYPIHETTVSRYFTQVYGTNKRKYLGDTKKKGITDYYLENSLDDTAKHFNIPKWTVRNYFQTIYGCSKKRYLDN